MKEYRKKLADTYLKGKGIEFGAQASPLYRDNSANVLYADRLTKTGSLDLFPELHNRIERIVETDIIIDLDRDDLGRLAKYDFDFFIANHVIEHLANPILWLERLYNVMKPGSILYLAVPDKRYTFDRHRANTSNAHLWKDYERKVEKVSASHLNDFIMNITRDVIKPEFQYLYFDKIPYNWFLKRKLYKIHRKRSIHVHVWDQPSFDDFLSFATHRLNCRFQILDSMTSKETDQEMIYILKKEA